MTTVSHPFMHLTVAALGAAALATFVRASTIPNTIRVPADYATLQLAINAASPGDIILVQTALPSTPITITKTLKIVGDPLATIDNSALDFLSPPQVPNITLAGPGSGIVELVRIRTTGTVSGSGVFAQNDAPRIKGTGFSELHVLDSDILRPAHINLNGSILGAAAIDVHVPLLVVANSTVEGGGPEADNFPGSLSKDGNPGITGATTVVATQSQIKGGRGWAGVYFNDGTIPAGGCPCAFIAGAGGPAVVCTELFTSGSTLTGGVGGVVLVSGVGPMGQQPAGPSAVASSQVDLPAYVTSASPPQVGAPWTISWSTPSNPVYLGVSSFPTAPIFVPIVGYSFSDYTATYFSGWVPGGTSQTQTFPVPNVSSLVGLEVVVQIWDPTTGLGGPHIRAVVP